MSLRTVSSGKDGKDGSEAGSDAGLSLTMIATELDKMARTLKSARAIRETREMCAVISSSVVIIGTLLGVVGFILYFLHLLVMQLFSHYRCEC